MEESFDVIVIGAGAAGLMAAAQLASRGNKTLLLEHNRQVGRKILISGGGRCNFTNRTVLPSDFHSDNLHFAKSALSRYTPEDFIDLVESYKIPYYEKKLGQLFCETSAKEIVDMLLSECKKYGAEIRLGQKILSVDKTENQFLLKDFKQSFFCSNLVIATGGLPLESLGASDFGYKIAKQFGLKTTVTQPALVPFVLFEDFSILSGVSLPVVITVNDRLVADDLLFTHKGLSGPAILKASLFWNPSDSLQINFVPGIDLQELLKKTRLQRPKVGLENYLKEFVPSRLIEKFRERYSWPSKILADLSFDEIEQVAAQLTSFKVTPKDTEGYRKAEVTKGGVCTSELSSKTLEARKVAGLYFIGEVVDVTGLLGGYNFQWAWASAHAVAEAILPGLD